MESTSSHRRGQDTDQLTSTFQWHTSRCSCTICFYTCSGGCAPPTRQRMKAANAAGRTPQLARPPTSPWAALSIGMATVFVALTTVGMFSQTQGRLLGGWRRWSPPPLHLRNLLFTSAPSAPPYYTNPTHEQRLDGTFNPPAMEVSPGVFPHSVIDAACPRFVHIEYHDAAGMGHRLSNLAMAMVAAQVLNATLAYDRLDFHSKAHGNYTGADDFFGLGVGEVMRAEMGRRFPYLTTVALPRMDGYRSWDAGGPFSPESALYSVWAAHAASKRAQCWVSYEVSRDDWTRDPKPRVKWIFAKKWAANEARMAAYREAADEARMAANREAAKSFIEDRRAAHVRLVNEAADDRESIAKRFPPRVEVGRSTGTGRLVVPPAAVFTSAASRVRRLRAMSGPLRWLQRRFESDSQAGEAPGEVLSAVDEGVRRLSDPTSASHRRTDGVSPSSTGSGSIAAAVDVVGGGGGASISPWSLALQLEWRTPRWESPTLRLPTLPLPPMDSGGGVSTSVASEPSAPSSLSADGRGLEGDGSAAASPPVLRIAVHLRVGDINPTSPAWMAVVLSSSVLPHVAAIAPWLPVEIHVFAQDDVGRVKLAPLRELAKLPVTSAMTSEASSGGPPPPSSTSAADPPPPPPIAVIVDGGVSVSFHFTLPALATLWHLTQSDVFVQSRSAFSEYAALLATRPLSFAAGGSRFKNESYWQCGVGNICCDAVSGGCPAESARRVRALLQRWGWDRGPVGLDGAAAGSVVMEEDDAAAAVLAGG